MKAIKTYISKLKHDLGLTIMGVEEKAQLNHLILIDQFIVPHIQNMELGSKLPEKIKHLMNGNLIDLTFHFKGQTTELTLYFKNDVLFNIDIKNKNLPHRNWEEIMTGVGAELYADSEVSTYRSYMN